MASERGHLEYCEGESGYEKAVNDSMERLVIVDWSAQWCRKCKFLKAKLEKFSIFYPDVEFAVMDVNKMPGAIIKQANVVAMPTLQIYKGGLMVKEIVGSEESDAVIAALRKSIEELSVVVKKVKVKKLDRGFKKVEKSE